MTVAEKPRFAACFNRLAVALRIPADEADAVMQRVYWDALSGLPIDAIEDSARALARSAQWFPKTSEWLSAAEEARSARALTACLPTPREDPWQSECDTCDDSGWETLRCRGDAVCGRTQGHSAHSFAVPCACRATNRTYQRRVEQQRQQARRGRD